MCAFRQETIRSEICEDRLDALVNRVRKAVLVGNADTSDRMAPIVVTTVRVVPRSVLPYHPYSFFHSMHVTSIVAYCSAIMALDTQNGFLCELTSTADAFLRICHH